MLRDAAELLLAASDGLVATLKATARRHRDTAMIGRTHGVHAEPTTFGTKVALWCLQADRDRTRLRSARDAVAVGKLSGAVGTYANVDPFVERHVCAALGLTPVPATQVIARDRHAEYLWACASVGATIELIAVELRHLQRTEVREVEEGFAAGQKGSSAMPHKRNPITAERLTGLARILRGNLVAGLEDVALWHERDISHSSVERVILPDSSLLAYYVLRTADRLVCRCPRSGCWPTSGPATASSSPSPSCWPSWPGVSAATPPTASCRRTPCGPGTRASPSVRSWRRTSG
jgi:adenylosuccinate lyase